MAAKSVIAGGLLFGAEFFTELHKKLEAKGWTRDQILEAFEREFKTGSGLAEKVSDLITSAKNQFLSLISGTTSIIINAVDGSSLLSEASDVFSWIDKDFKNYGADERGPATKETRVQVFEMSKDATFKDMFGSLSSNLETLCLTQAQIKEFVKMHRTWLRTDGYGTFFLFKSNNNFFVALVGVGSGGTLRVGVFRLEYSLVWYAGGRRCLVAPQLAV